MLTEDLKRTLDMYLQQHHILKRRDYKVMQMFHFQEDRNIRMKRVEHTTV